MRWPISIDRKLKSIVLNEEVLGSVPKRKHDSHKGQNGRLLVVAGSIDYPGAAALCSYAALRSGCDMVTVACPKDVAYTINSLYPEIITKKLAGDYITFGHVRIISELSKKADAMLIGPGLSEKSGSVIKAILKKIRLPMVVDADSIRHVRMSDGVIITPHKLEFESCFGLKLSDDISKNTEILMKKCSGGVILLKGSCDIIVSEKQQSLNLTGNSGMTGAGTGDVLAGIVASMLSRGQDAHMAASIGAFISGKAGDMAFKEYGNCLTASDIIRFIPDVLKKR